MKFKINNVHRWDCGCLVEVVSVLNGNVQYRRIKSCGIHDGHQVNDVFTTDQESELDIYCCGGFEVLSEKEAGKLRLRGKWGSVAA